MCITGAYEYPEDRKCSTKSIWESESSSVKTKDMNRWAQKRPYKWLINTQKYVQHKRSLISQLHVIIHQLTKVKKCWWQQPKCPSAQEWIKKMWHMYAMEYYSDIKGTELCHLQDVDGPRDCHTEGGKSEREKQISEINVYMWNLEKRYRWTYCKAEIETQI